MNGLKRGGIAVVGVAEADLGKSCEHITALDLMGQAAIRALQDCGLRRQDVDGVIAATSSIRLAPLALSEYLGIQPKYFNGTNVGGSSFMAHLAAAQLAIEAGLCSVVLIAHGSNQRSVGRKQASPREFNPWETPYAPLLPATAYAFAAQRHMHDFGTTRHDLAEVAVAARQWAMLNPAAWEKSPLSHEDVITARPLADPLTVRDCCLVTDGGAAMVVMSAERARALDKPPVYVLGVGMALSHSAISMMPDLARTAAAISGPQAFGMAGLNPSDIDLLGLYDAFTINPILFLEDLGFCPKGEGGRFVGEGRLRPGGSLPVNTNGGGLSYTHPGMYGLHAMVEVVRQLRGECGARQVVDAAIGLAHGNGGVLSSQCTAIFGRADTQ